MMEFRPRRGPTLFTAFATLLCLGLGVWQIQRLHWKEGLIAARAAAVSAPPIALPRDAAAARGMEYRHVAVSGVLRNDKELYRYWTSDRGDPGYDVLTPLRQADGRYVFINRGFVPADRRDPATRRAGEITGETRVVGLLRLAPATRPGWFTPDNQPGQNMWYWVDLPAMAAAAGVAPVAPFYVDADATPNPGGWPKGGGTVLTLPNHHLQYAITWFSLAVAAVVVYVVSQRENRETK
jgi:surfeit locus 1 family protein